MGGGLPGAGGAISEIPVISKGMGTCALIGKADQHACCVQLKVAVGAMPVVVTGSTRVPAPNRSVTVRLTSKTTHVPGIKTAIIRLVTTTKKPLT